MTAIRVHKCKITGCGCDGEGVKFLRAFAGITAPLTFYTRVQFERILEFMSGRKNIGDTTKVIRGTDQPCRIQNDAAAGFTKFAQVPSSGLSGMAKRIYEVIANELWCKNILETVNLDLVIAYCREMGLYYEMAKDLKKEGYTLTEETKFGEKIHINPKRKIQETALANAKALATEFGFTPASRARIVAMISGKTENDDFSDFDEV